MILLILGLLGSCCFSTASAGPAADNKESYKDQYCTDPRTMRKHAAYTEWADAYSCTRHRCQPGGRNLAIYTVGCKRVEAPESAIECEEVVEDTNMQFPFCCTRLRCLVVVRGEVWTRVLGQPWEVLPAAPWSHMYKMKKPPPGDTTFLPKTNDQGPVYELSDPESDGGHEKVLRSGKKTVTDSTDCNEVVPRAAAPPPDIVIALSTNKEVKEHKKESARRTQIKHETLRHKRVRKTTHTSSQYFDEDQERERDRHEPETLAADLDELPLSTEKSIVEQDHAEVTLPHSVLQLLHPADASQTDQGSDEGSRNKLDAEGGVTPTEASDERFYANAFGVTQKPLIKNAHHQVAWTEIPQNQWNEHEGMDVENRVLEPAYHQPEFQAQEAQEKPSTSSAIKEEKPTNLQALVDAIGTRMRDIENVVQRMSEKVHQVKPTTGGATDSSGEKRPSAEADVSHKHHKSDYKRPSTEAEHYNRFTVRNRGSKYLHSTTDSTTEQPLHIEDTNLNGYFSDASNSVLRRANPPKEPPPTYMAPVENRRKMPAHIAVASENSDDADKKRKKHTHKKRRGKSGHTHKKHHSKDDKRKHFNRLSSVEIDKNVVSLEDSSAIASK